MNFITVYINSWWHISNISCQIIILTCQITMSTCRKNIITTSTTVSFKSLGPIDCKFHGHGKNDGFVLYEFITKQCSRFCKYTNISVMKKRSKKITCQQ